MKSKTTEVEYTIRLHRNALLTKHHTPLVQKSCPGAKGTIKGDFNCVPSKRCKICVLLYICIALLSDFLLCPLCARLPLAKLAPLFFSFRVIQFAKLVFGFFSMPISSFLSDWRLRLAAEIANSKALALASCHFTQLLNSTQVLSHRKASASPVI